MFDYGELPERTLRLLTVKPATYAEPIVGFLNVVHLDKAPQFEAFSYVWGPPIFTYPLEVMRGVEETVGTADGTGSTAHHILITEGLADGIKHFRHQSVPLVVWIDQICINQKSLAERSAQVKLMGEVYMRAANVLVWLGADPSGLAPVAESFMQQISMAKASQYRPSKIAFDDTSIPAISVDPVPYGTQLPFSQVFQSLKEGAPQWAALKQLLELPYWERAWIFQEIKLARSKRALWGNTEIDLDAIFDSLTWILISETQMGGVGENIPPRLMYVAVDTLRPETKVRSLSWGLGSMRLRKTTDPRDKIYAILSLLDQDDPQCPTIAVDYTKSVLYVYLDATMAVIKQDADLGILSNVIHGEECMDKLGKEEWPTWIPDWVARPGPVALVEYLPSANACGRRKNGNLLAEVFLSNTLTIEQPTLPTAGIRIGTISHISTFWRPPKFDTGADSLSSLFYKCIAAAWRLAHDKATAKSLARTIICASGSLWDGTGDLTEMNQSGTPNMNALYSGEVKVDIQSMNRVRAMLYKTSSQTASTYHLMATLFADFGIRARLQAGETWDTLAQEIRFASDLAQELYVQQARVQESEYWQYYDYIPEEERENARPSAINVRQGALEQFKQQEQDAYQVLSEMLYAALRPCYSVPAALDDAVSTLCVLSYQKSTIHDFARYQQLTSRFLRVTAPRRFFVTSDGKMGLGPICMREGDTVVILCGGKVPFLLREAEAEGRWRLVGECYVEGAMEGEAIGGFGGENSAEGLEMFTLV